MKDSELVMREAEKLYERSKNAHSDERAAPFFVGGRILDAIALVLKNQERAAEDEQCRGAAQKAARAGMGPL